MRLAIVHPEVAARDCKHCQKWLYDEKTGKVVERHGIPIERPKGTHPPCRLHIGCPKGSPENSRALTSQNRRAYHHYLECRAVGQFPDDPIVRRNAALIRHVEESIKEGKLDILMARVGALAPFLEAVKATT